MTFVSHAQNFEDVMLWRALKHVQNGLYIDVGAQDPSIDSVSLAFYERGWRGIHVEPTVQYSTRLRNARPDEEVLQVAIGEQAGALDLFCIADTGLSTTSSTIADQHRDKGWKIDKTSVPVITLDMVFDTIGQQEIHWLKVDVEGAEKEVLAGWKESPLRPWVVIIEATRPSSTELSHHEWEDLILRKGYLFAYFDGLNRYYVSENHADLKDSLSTPPNVFDKFVLSANHHLCGISQTETQLVRSRMMRAERTQESARLALKNKLDIADQRYRELEGAYLNQTAKVTHIQEMWRQTIYAYESIQTSTFWRATFPLRWIAIQIRLLRQYGPGSRWHQLMKKICGRRKAVQSFKYSSSKINGVVEKSVTAIKPSKMLSTKEKKIYDAILNAIQEQEESGRAYSD